MADWQSRYRDKFSDTGVFSRLLLPDVDIDTICQAVAILAVSMLALDKWQQEFTEKHNQLATVSRKTQDKQAATYRLYSELLERVAIMATEIRNL